MARYRSKDETDLRWNDIRRRLTRELDTQISKWREAALNKILSDAWAKYTAALESGEKLAIESEYADFAAKALTGKIGIDLKEV
jgi:hypothetical protein